MVLCGFFYLLVVGVSCIAKYNVLEHFTGIDGVTEVPPPKNTYKATAHYKVYSRIQIYETSPFLT